MRPLTNKLGLLKNLLSSCNSCAIRPPPRVILSNVAHSRGPFPCVAIWCFLILLVFISEVVVRCELNPPKRLHRVIAGFYAYHPSYDTDKPAPILTLRPEGSKNTVHYHYHHDQTKQQNQKHGDEYAYAYGYGGAKVKNSGNHHKPKHHVGHYSKKSKHKYKSKSKSKYKSKSKEKGYYSKKHYGGGHHYHQYPYWGVFSKLVDAYVVLAHRMAEYYGHKYNYPVNLLYWQIIDVMFD